MLFPRTYQKKGLWTSDSPKRSPLMTPTTSVGLMNCDWRPDVPIGDVRVESSLVLKQTGHVVDGGDVPRPDGG